MTTLGAVILALIAVVPEGDACRDPELPTGAAAGVARPPASARDRSEAAAYRFVGDEAVAAGDADAARVAYRQTLRRDPADASTRARLAALCRARTSDQRQAARADDATAARFDEGLRLMKAGDRDGAIAAFRTVRAEDPDDAAAALLEGICEFEQGRDARATSLLEHARHAPALAGTALFFLGVIALRDGEGDRASSLLAAAAANDERVATNSASLDRLARRDGRLQVSALTEVGWDSNVSLAPDGTAIIGGAADGYATGVAGVFVRPRRGTGLHGRLLAQYRKQFRIDAYDLGDFSGAVGARMSGGPSGQFLAAEYGYDLVTLGDAFYLSAHRLAGNGRFVHGPFSILGALSTRFESFLTEGAAAYTGWRHETQIELQLQVAGALVVGVGYRGVRDGTREASLSYVEHGPVATARWWLGGRVRVAGEARWSRRGYDAADVDPAVRRTDGYLDAGGVAELDVSDGLAIRLTGTARRARSNLSDFQYTKLTVAAGLVYTLGVLQ